MRHGSPDMREQQAERLTRDPGAFEPTTAFRVAQHLAEHEELSIGAHNGSRLTPVAIGGFRKKNGKMELRSAFAPIMGPLGALPPVYGEMLQREERNRSKAMGSFFSLFAARFSELFVAATEKYRLARGLRWSRDQDNNAFRKTLLSLTGFGTGGLSEKVGVKEDVLLRFSGLLANRNRNATALTAMLREFTGLDVTVEQFRRRWVPLPVHEQSQLGQTGGLSLGKNVSAGSAVQDFSGGFRIVLGPVGYADYLALTPGSRRLAEICAVTRLFVGSAFDFDVQVILKKEDVPFCQLGQPDAPARLGWNSWARVAPAEKDSTDAIVTEREGSALSA
ncbi:type VI secretion system baseplate subunit TssG [Agrobacterium rubi]|uniref:Type VI secretion system baseplate subunit TssG n=2 Tax=Agrobacterium rubi TaxID=28099 RepID=A0AAE7USN5_9HYPH|nr:type VI secretion system baseplate subunit TssG [Agrobacterium rubi]MBP1878648.1 type VI secretion system protein ImpH [Agrobacterium rubi]MCL6652991.1 type VI secretion protein [Agrobacterium rubi]NTE88729.1 type VI secretion system baseplate subunit TssG [Agrobacterium rubi]NTF04557.1 type VI secretion system baseplate subunit TssG [Agrobacterium rubi]NTF10089.1 type VI secretion system baseplate subunit TssG [Agrobacterium rubi]